MTEVNEKAELFIGEGDFPARRGESPESHRARVAGVLARVSGLGIENVTLSIDGTPPDDDISALLRSAVDEVTEALGADGSVKGLTIQERKELLIDRIVAASEGQVPRLWKCTGLVFPDGNPFEKSAVASAMALAAKSLCETCAARPDCLAQALRDGTVGIQGGLSLKERKQLPKRRV